MFYDCTELSSCSLAIAVQEETKQLTISSKPSDAGYQRQQRELQNALRTAQLYEQQVNELIASLKKADRNWTQAEIVRLATHSDFAVPNDRF